MFPGLIIQELLPITVGWNTQVYILNHEYTIKIPRTRSAEVGIRKEIAISGAIQGRIPVGMPQYVAEAKTAEISAFAYKFIKGMMMTTKPLGDAGGNFDPTKVDDHAQYRSIQKQLAGLLSSIHRLEPAIVLSVLSSFGNETWAETYSRIGSKWDSVLIRAFHGKQLSGARSLLKETINSITGCNFQEKFIHGDFGGWNIIYDQERQEITCLLDWADCRMGDPSLDFAELIYDYGEAYAREVLDLYGETSDPNLMERARLYLKLEGFRDLHYGLATNSHEFREKGRRIIEKMIEGQGYL